MAIRIFASSGVFRRTRRISAVLLSVGLLSTPILLKAEFARNEDPASVEVLKQGVEAAQATIAMNLQLQNEACRSVSDLRWPGLRVENGVVTGSEILNEIQGFAAAAGVTGGLGGRLAVVTTAVDYSPSNKEIEVPGSLRSIIDRAVRAQVPTWVVFSPELGPRTTITLKEGLNVPSNTTLDGSCSDVTIEALSKVGSIALFNKQNVIITRLRFRKTDYISLATEEDQRSTLRLNGTFDRVAIIHNDISECGDGCIDMTASLHQMPNAARVTIAFNRIADHDKAMLFGTWDCNSSNIASVPACDINYLKAREHIPAVLFLTLQGNMFLRTSQRHPRIWGRAMAHLVNNVIAYSPLPRRDGGWSSAYGTFVTNAGSALVERNVYLPLTTLKSGVPRNVWTTTSPGARYPREVEGYTRIEANISNRPGILEAHKPERVPVPAYLSPLTSAAVERMTIERAVACVAARAGRSGASAWDKQLCS